MSLLHALPGDGRRKDLDKIQENIGAALAERDMLEAQPRPLDECRSLLAENMGVLSSLGYRARTVLRARDLRGMLRIDPAAPLTLADLEWLFGTDTLLDQMQKALATEAEALPAPVGASEYSSKLAEIDGRLHALYLEEEREVLRLFDAGIKAVRRENADPAIVFEAWGDIEPSEAQ